MASQGAARTRDLAGPVVGAALALLILAFSFQIRDTSGGFYGPRFWPQLIGGLMLAINAWVVIKTVLGRPEPRDEAATPAIDLRSAGVRHWITAVLVLGFPLIVQLMGFLAGSAVFLVAFMVALGYRRA